MKDVLVFPGKRTRLRAEMNSLKNLTKRQQGLIVFRRRVAEFLQKANELSGEADRLEKELEEDLRAYEARFPPKREAMQCKHQKSNTISA